MNQNEESDSKWESFARLAIGVAIIAVIALVLVVKNKNTPTYETQTFKGDGITYSIKYDRASPQQTRGGLHFYEGRDKATGKDMELYVGRAMQSKSDCQPGGNVKVVAKLTVEGKQHNLCYAAQRKLYAMNFTHNGQWYFLSIFPKEAKTNLNKETIKTIAESVQIKS